MFFLLRKFLCTGLFLILSIFLWSSSVEASEQGEGPEVEWEKNIEGIYSENGYSVQQTGDRGYIIAGTIYNHDTRDFNVYLLKTDSSGNKQWEKTFGGSKRDEGYSVQQTSDGGYIVVGYTKSFGAGDNDVILIPWLRGSVPPPFSTDDSDVYLIKTDAAGNKQWEKIFKGREDDVGRSVQQADDGGYIIAGWTGGPFGPSVYLLKTDSSGNKQWEKFIGGESSFYGYSVQRTRDGGYIITGHRYLDYKHQDEVYLVKTDAAGNKQWEKTFGRSLLDDGSFSLIDDRGYSVQQTSDDGYIIAGISEMRIYLIKTDSSGNKQWDKTFMCSERRGFLNVANSVQQTNDGGYIISGYTNALGLDDDVYLIKTDSSGNKQWEKAFRSSDSYNSDRGYSVQQTSDGGYIIAGITYSVSSKSIDVYLIKLKPQLPVASFTITPDRPMKGEQVTFDASASYDLNGQVISYHWDFGDGSTAEGKTVTHKYSETGSYQVSLTVTDNEGWQSVFTYWLIVGDIFENYIFKHTPGYPVVGETVTFDATGYVSPRVNVVSYEWNFGDDSPAVNGIRVNHAYNREGIYLVTLIVRTDDNQEFSKINLINVTAANSGQDAAEKMGKYEKGGTLIAEPVDTATGAHVIERNVLTINGAQPVSFNLSYNSLLLKEGPLGKGWSHNFETRLEPLPDGNIKVHWTSSRENTFTGRGGNTFTSTDPATRYDQLVKNQDGTYTLIRKDQKIYQFDTAGNLISLSNGRGQSVVLSYDAEGRLSAVTEPVSGKVVNLHYNNEGLIDRVTDSANRQVSFTYDAGHNLTGITGADGQTTTYTYNADGRILTATNAEGRQLFSNTYDEKGRIVAQDDAVKGNQVTRFSYDETTQPGRVITTVTDRNGNTRVYVHDSNYQLLSVTDELGNTTTYTYDADGNCTGVTDAGGNTTTYTYDAKGNLLTITDPAGNVTRMTYDDRNNLLSVENPAGKKTLYSYDANNNLTSVTDPLGNTATYTYDPDGLMLTKTTPGSGITTCTYENGLLKTITYPEGNTVTYGYDAAGRLVSITDAAGKTTTMTYDNADNLTSIIDPLGNRVQYTYDSHHNKLTETDAKGNVTRYTYNGNGKLISVIDALNNETRYEYDGEDRLIKTIDARGNATTMTYDAKGRVTGITDPLGNTVHYQYDAVDNLISITDAMGNSTTSTYDRLKNLLTVTNALGYTVTNQYDNLNRLVRVTDPLNRHTQFDYDDLNRLVLVTDALGGQSRQTFDADGNRTSLIDPNNNQTLFTFDKNGRLVEQTSATGKITYTYDARNLLIQKTNGRGQVTTYQYDDAGRIQSFTDPTGTVTYTYDANGNVITVSDGTGTITREYDALNRVIKYTDTRGNIIEYTYDAVGNLTTLTYPGGRQVQYQYDATNRLISVTDWAGRVTTYEYDTNGRLTKTTRPNGTVLTLSYDRAGQLIQQKDVDKDGNIIVQYDFTYDPAGNVKTEESSVEMQPFTMPNATMTYTSGNRLATYNGQAVEYDADGNMTTGPLSGDMASYTFDSRNRLIRVWDTSYLYDAENNRISVSDSVYQTINYVINPHASLSQVLIKTDAGGNQTFYVYGLGLIGQENPDGSYLTYHYDRRGSTVALVDEGGWVTDRFQYGPYGELVYRSGTNATPFLYNGRDGVITDENGLYYMRARYYNPEIKRFANHDIIMYGISSKNHNPYLFVSANPVSNIDPMGLYVVGADPIYSPVGLYDFSKSIQEGWNNFKAGAQVSWNILKTGAQKVGSILSAFPETYIMEPAREASNVIADSSIPVYEKAARVTAIVGMAGLNAVNPATYGKAVSRATVRAEVEFGITTQEDAEYIQELTDIGWDVAGFGMSVQGMVKAVKPLPYWKVRLTPIKYHKYLRAERRAALVDPYFQTYELSQRYTGPYQSKNK